MPDHREEIAREVCERIGHEWAPAGGGLLICTACMTERWDDEAPAPITEGDE